MFAKAWLKFLFLENFGMWKKGATWKYQQKNQEILHFLKPQKLPTFSIVKNKSDHDQPERLHSGY